MNSIAVDIAGFAFNPLSREPVMLLKRADEIEPIKSLVPIIMGPPEAQSIISALQGYEPPRPMTHDLLANIIATLHADVVRVDVHNFHEGTFFAAVTLAQNGVTFVVDARPSDAMALAIRANAPLYMDSDVFNAASVETAALSGGTAADDSPRKMRDATGFGSTGFSSGAGLGQTGFGIDPSIVDGADLSHPSMQNVLDQIHNFAENVQPSDFKFKP